VTVQIQHPELSVTEFYQTVLAQLDEQAPPTSRAALLAHFDSCMARQAALRLSVVVFIDNGEVIAPDLLDELLRLCRRKGGGARNLHILLAARNSSDGIFAQVRDEIRFANLDLHVELGPLASDEIRDYLHHRLAVAAVSDSSIFKVEAIDEFRRFTGGVPRMINILADVALMLAFNRNQYQVSAFDVRGAADHLHWVEFDAERESHNSSGSNDQDSNRDFEAYQTGHIRIEIGDTTIADMDLPIGKISLGRAESNDIRLDSQYISRHHCQILTTAHYAVIEDLQSQNGIMVGGRRVSVHRLRHGDKVGLGEHKLLFSVSESAKPASATVATIPRIKRLSADQKDHTRTQVLVNDAQPDLSEKHD
jgi:hypothetical protein